MPMPTEPMLEGSLGNFSNSSVHYLLEPGPLTRTDLIVDTPKVAHNTYLEVLAEIGVVGLALFLTLLLFCMGCAAKAVRNFHDKHDVYLEVLARALLIALIGLLAADFFDSEQFQKALWLLLGLCPAMLAISRTGERTGAAKAE